MPWTFKYPTKPAMLPPCLGHLYQGHSLVSGPSAVACSGGSPTGARCPHFCWDDGSSKLQLFMEGGIMVLGTNVDATIDAQWKTSISSGGHLMQSSSLVVLQL